MNTAKKKILKVALIIAGVLFVAVPIVAVLLIEVSKDVTGGEAYGFSIGATKEETYATVVKLYGNKDVSVNYFNYDGPITSSVEIKNFTRKEPDLYFKVDGLIIGFNSSFEVNSLTLFFKENRLVRMKRVRSLIAPI